MKYDKKSFLAGISVGTQLKGWAGVGGGGSTYVVSAPVNFVLSVDGWNGTTYELTAQGYNIGPHGVHIGLPADSSIVNTQAAIEAALTVPDAGSGSKSCTMTISAVNAPTKDIKIALFGLVML